MPDFIALDPKTAAIMGLQRQRDFIVETRDSGRGT